MNYKKEILKKYMGKGGIITDTIKEIPGTLKTMGKNIAKGKILKGIDPGGLVSGSAKGLKKIIKRTINGPAKESKIIKAVDNKHKEEGDDMMAGREKYNPNNSSQQEIIDIYDSYQDRFKK